MVIFLVVPLATLGSFHRASIELVNKFKGKLKIGAPVFERAPPDFIEHVNCE